ncbi:urea transporter [Alkalilacustris brevis]|uniref:urea transporter n=1 Tax=Alkalilacustris brevis TaxID=2026338 RepID=UPI0012D34293|nr:urea transporter [Alkalilacustris brevis]
MEVSSTENQFPTPRQMMAVAAQLYLRPLASILLIGSAWVGAGMWILLLQQPLLAIVAFLALSIIEIISQIMARGDASVFGAMTRANALLCSLAAAFLMGPMNLPFLLQVVLMFGALCVGLYFTLIFRRLLRNTSIPPVILPYVTLAAILAILIPDGMSNATHHFDWPAVEVVGFIDLPHAFLQTMGGFLYSPWILSGAVISLLILAWSPAMFLAGIIGWLMGALTSMGLVASGFGSYWPPASYNFFLSGMALGAVFFLPGPRGMAIAAFAGMICALISAVLMVYAGPSGIAYFPIPFGLTLITGILALDNPAFAPGVRRNLTWFERPEDAWIKDAWSRKRWGELGELLAIPLVGPVEVVQGFDSRPSHRGPWKHALDFQRPPSGENRERPSLFGEPVYSPAVGEVVEMRNNVADNPPGMANYGDNWGNYLVLRTGAGNHVLLAHFMQGSIAVARRQWVDYTTYLGVVGNSGRSTVPHLHMQVQKSSEPGAPTQHFSLANYHTFGGENGDTRIWHAAGTPREGEIVEGARTNPAVYQLMTASGPGRSIFTVTTKGEVPDFAASNGSIIVEAHLTEAGNLVYSSSEGSEAELKLDADAARVIRIQGAPGTAMVMAMIAAPSVPFCAQPGLRWTDVLPLTELQTMQYLRKVLSPFEVQVFVAFECECLAVPDSFSPALVIRSRPLKRYPGLPISCTMTVEPLRDPARIVAEYPSGTVTYLNASFEPRSM